jgi:hypothetical protein
LPIDAERSFVQRVSLSLARLEQLRHEFLAKRYFKIQNFLGEELLLELQQVWHLVKPHALRKDIVISDKITSERHMRTASAIMVDQNSKEVDRIYRNKEFITFLSQVTSDKICPLEDDIEKYVMNALERKGDLHGAHLDSFPYSCTFVIDAPYSLKGGFLKVSHTREDFDSDKGTKIELHAGDMFFFCSSELIHQVTTVESLSGERVILNFAYANPDSRTVLSYSRAALYT